MTRPIIVEQEEVQIDVKNQEYLSEESAGLYTEHRS